VAARPCSAPSGGAKRRSHLPPVADVHELDLAPFATFANPFLGDAKGASSAASAFQSRTLLDFPFDEIRHLFPLSRRHIHGRETSVDSWQLNV
jgi:hypothetical protein